ncbi:hypothetical protein [Diaphorobacter sp. J5-51]|uniref:hypothetical protein n=1 Tax=Diaphorobacter sp. J5-51 TaxID=680496 RepID=UPI001F16C1E9|nr:hypothetical protein [Diaphorobacter sp. J5-51]
MSENHPTKRVRIAYIGVDNNNVAALTVALEYRQGEAKLATFLQKKSYLGDIVAVETVAKTLLRDRKVDEISYT